MAVTTGTRNPGRAPVPECEETTSGGQWEGRAVASWDSCPSVTLRRGEGYLAWRRGPDKRQGLKGSWGRERAPEAAASRSYPPSAPHTRAEAQAGVAGAHLDTCFGTINSFSSPIMSL